MASPEPERPPKSPLASSVSDRNSKLSALLESIDADLGFTKKAPAPASDESGVNSFRRAKFFFPKIIEEQRKAAEAEKEAAAKRAKAPKGRGAAARDAKPTTHYSVSPSASPEPRSDQRSDHEPKRRKVSRETPARGSTPDRSPRSRPSSGHRSRDVRSVSRPESGSPPPRSRVDKGKGPATTHSVNANVVFTQGSSDNRQQTSSPSTGTTTRAAKDKDASVITIDSDSASDSDVDLSPYKPRGKTSTDDKKDNKDKDDSDSDDLEIIDHEFAEYILRAKDKAKAQRADLEAVVDTNGASTTVATAVPASQATTASLVRSGSSFTLSGETPASAPTPVTASQPPPGDQQYRILITSHFPEEVPALMVLVRMDQELRYAKDAYIAHTKNKCGVQLTDAEAKSVLLTWKGSKIYNFTTGESLGIKPDAKGRFRDADIAAGSGSGSGAGSGASSNASGFQSGGLHLEIWTEALYEAFLQEEDKRRRRNLGEVVEEDLLSDDDGEGMDGGVHGSHGDGAVRGTSLGPGGSGADAVAAASQTGRIRLVLKSRDHENLKITAHSNTTIETLATAFRLQRVIEPGKTVVIMWDGEELDAGMTVSEAEMEDMDGVEVHIR